MDYATDDKLVIGNETFKYDGKVKRLSSGESYFSTAQTMFKSEQVIRSLLSRCRTFQFHDTSDKSHIRTSALVGNNRYLYSDGGNLPAMLYLIQQKYPKYFHRIETYVQRVVPDFASFVLEPDRIAEHIIFLNWQEKDRPEYILGPAQMSDGSLRFIALATLLLQPPEMLPNVILIDEPELGLHPQAIDILAQMIENVSHHAQVIVATQSERLLNSFSPEDIIVADHRADKQCSSFQRLNRDQLREWWDEYSMAELWEKNLLGGQP